MERMTCVAFSLGKRFMCIAVIFLNTVMTFDAGLDQFAFHQTLIVRTVRIMTLIALAFPDRLMYGNLPAADIQNLFMTGQTKSFHVFLQKPLKLCDMRTVT